MAYAPTMDHALLITHVERAVAAYRAADQALIKARGKVEDAVAAAADGKVPQTELIRLTGFSREHVRRLTRTGQERDRLFYGGPLDGQPVQKRGEYWEHFRDDAGNPITTDVGDTEWSGPHQRFYYWADGPDGLTYVHLTRIDKNGDLT